jgi:putative membrane protein
MEEAVSRLAIERTKLAEERTSLAYIRTGMSLLLGGLFFVGFFTEDALLTYVGYGTIVVAMIFTVYGFHHNVKSRKVIDTILNEVR